MKRRRAPQFMRRGYGSDQYDRTYEHNLPLSNMLAKKYYIYAGMEVVLTVVLLEELLTVVLLVVIPMVVALLPLLPTSARLILPM